MRPVPASSRACPLPQGLRTAQGRRIPCGSGFTREEASPASRSYSASRCIGVTTRPSLSAWPRLVSMKYTRSSSSWPLSTR
ncbi:hypothetical protein EFK07_04580 [Pseudomonas putida]|uniref:Uncharacterized protein n=1 Tax=Pseudomonas putida TaxID=303 RepID=A0A3M8TIM7_PSEPU|nr:hypothetical protein EFK07_04580 [Pseudomonas putida]